MRRIFSVACVIGLVVLMMLSGASVGMASVANCADGIDNDRDGLIDFPADPDCSSRDDDTEVPAPDGGGGG